MSDIRNFTAPALIGVGTRLHNLAATRRPCLAFDLDGETIELWLAPLRDPLHPPLADVTSTGLGLGSGQARLRVTSALLGRGLRPWLARESLTGLPPALAAIARQTALAPLRAALGALAGMTSEWADPDPDPDPGPDSVAPPVALGLWPTAAPTGRPVARLDLDEDAAAALVPALERLPCPSCAIPWPELPIRFRPWLGATRLTPRELAGLEPGDLLLLPPAYANDPVRVLLVQRRQPLAAARLEDHRLLIEPLEPSLMSDATPEPVAASLDPDALEVRLDFDLGHLQVPLRELRMVQPGYSFTLDFTNRPPVRILAGDQVIGRGELVTIDGRLGVRVVTLSSPAASA